ncbi:MAG: hypothetical protein EZS28_029874 [Streblomastix strix]|uniref:Uncharacterized protein n=1 Tax=Streblomastix strix TaxID=222440 RepID=A0A5J4UWC7_9EUKA|nr:MAG: hypothetical protein EZS28_029874 [Streblomastix strix]
MLRNNVGKNHVGYYYKAKVINIALMLENDIILKFYPLLVAASSKFLQLINRTEQQIQAISPLSSSRVIISGFSGGIIVQAKR